MMCDLTRHHDIKRAALALVVEAGLIGGSRP
jgi:hypothetical protein